MYIINIKYISSLLFKIIILFKSSYKLQNLIIFENRGVFKGCTIR